MSPRLFLLASLILLASLLLPAFAARTQTIDQLHTVTQVQHFIDRVQKRKGYSFNPAKPIFGIPNYQVEFTAAGASPFEKADFDDNGYTDLLVNTYLTLNDSVFYCLPQSYVIFAYPNDSFRIASITPVAITDFLAARTLYLDGKPCISVQAITSRIDSLIHKQYETLSDTLIYAFGQFIERPFAPAKPITRIRLSVCCGYTPRGDYDLTLDAGSSAVKLDKNRDWYPKTAVDSGGIFTANLDSARRNKILGLIWAMDGAKSNRKIVGEVPTDLATKEIELSYADGTSKKIIDHGVLPNRSLLYAELELGELVDTVDWRRIALAPPTPAKYPTGKP